MKILSRALTLAIGLGLVIGAKADHVLYHSHLTEAQAFKAYFWFWVPGIILLFLGIWLCRKPI